MGAESAREVIDAAISYDRESTRRGILEVTKSQIGQVTSSMRMTIEARHQLVA
jgi:hypothetical protein